LSWAIVLALLLAGAGLQERLLGQGAARRHRLVLFQQPSRLARFGVGLEQLPPQVLQFQAFDRRDDLPLLDLLAGLDRNGGDLAAQKGGCIGVGRPGGYHRRRHHPLVGQGAGDHLGRLDGQRLAGLGAQRDASLRAIDGDAPGSQRRVAFMGPQPGGRDGEAGGQGCGQHVAVPLPARAKYTGGHRALREGSAARCDRPGG
jgi:hypothetical protein